MLHIETVEPFTLGLLKQLMIDEDLNQFVLVGGTALALQMGNRQSIDLDLFTIQDFVSEDLKSNLISKYNDFQVTIQTPQTLLCNINDIKVDFIRFKYPFIRPLLEVDGIRMLSIEDIAAMKLDAIAGRGSKKDFFDLYFILKKYSLETILEFYKEKYPHQTLFHIVRSLAYFADADLQPDPIVFDKKTTWSKVKKALSKEIQKI